MLALAVLAEAVLAGYLAMLAWFWSAWMVDDSMAFRMTEADWYSVAAQRALLDVVIAAVFAAVAHTVNRQWLMNRRPGSRLLPRLAPVLGASIALAGVAGAVDFAIRKPFM
jgi:hypothetical protein